VAFPLICYHLRAGASMSRRAPSGEFTLTRNLVA
jgi:hypothetical protein